MLSSFAVTVPFFALILLGYLAARRGMLSDAAIPGLNVFVLYFALPCALFRFGMNTPLLQLLGPGVLATYALCALLMIALTIALTWRGPVSLKDAAFGAQVAAFPNTGYMGLPLLHVGGSSSCEYDDLDHRCRHRPDEFRMHRACAMAGGVQARPPRRYRYGFARRALNPLLGHCAGRGKLGHRSQAGRPDRRNRSHACRCSDAGGALHHRRRAVACQQIFPYSHTCFPVLAGRVAQTSCASDVGRLCRKSRPGARRRDIRL